MTRADEVLLNVQSLLDSDLPQIRISQDTGVRQPLLSDLRNKRKPIENLTGKTLKLLSDYWEAQND